MITERLRAWLFGSTLLPHGGQSPSVPPLPRRLLTTPPRASVDQLSQVAVLRGEVIEQERLDLAVQVGAVVTRDDDHMGVPHPIRAVPEADPESAITKPGGLGQGQMRRGKALDQLLELLGRAVIECPGRIGSATEEVEFDQRHARQLITTDFPA